MLNFANHALLSVLRWDPAKNRKRIIALLLAATTLTTLFGFAAQAGQGPSQWCSDGGGMEEPIINSPATFNVEIGGPVGPSGNSWIVCASPTPWGDGTPAPTGGAAWFGSTQGTGGGNNWVGCGSDTNSTVLAFGCNDQVNTNLSNSANPSANIGTGNWVNVAGTQVNAPSAGAGTDCASGTVAVSVSSCASGTFAAVSGTGSATATGGFCPVCISWAGETGAFDVAISGTGTATSAGQDGGPGGDNGVYGIAISGLGNAANTGSSGSAISGTGTAASQGGVAAISGTGNSTGMWDGNWNAYPMFAISGLGDATGWHAVAGKGNANGPVDPFWGSNTYAVSGLGNSAGQCLAVSGTGNATSDSGSHCAIFDGGWPLGGIFSSGAAISGTGPASGWVAISGAGTANGNQGAIASCSGCTPTAPLPGIAVSSTGDASGVNAASGTGDVNSNTYEVYPGVPVGTAVSGTGDASGGIVAISGTGSANASVVSVSGRKFIQFPPEPDAFLGDLAPEYIEPLEGFARVIVSALTASPVHTSGGGQPSSVDPLPPPQPDCERCTATNSMQWVNYGWWEKVRVEYSVNNANEPIDHQANHSALISSANNECYDPDGVLQWSRDSGMRDNEYSSYVTQGNYSWAYNDKWTLTSGHYWWDDDPGGDYWGEFYWKFDDGELDICKQF
jgi:hypothetical protein